MKEHGRRLRDDLYLIVHPIDRSSSAVLKRQRFVCGASPAYGDYILFSLFQWARIASPHELVAAGSPLDAWRSRMLDLYDGFARNAAAA